MNPNLLTSSVASHFSKTEAPFWVWEVMNTGLPLSLVFSPRLNNYPRKVRAPPFLIISGRSLILGKSYWEILDLFLHPVPAGRVGRSTWHAAGWEYRGPDGPHSNSLIAWNFYLGKGKKRRPTTPAPPNSLLIKQGCHFKNMWLSPHPSPKQTHGNLMGEEAIRQSDYEILKDSMHSSPLLS